MNDTAYRALIADMKAHLKSLNVLKLNNQLKQER